MANVTPQETPVEQASAAEAPHAAAGELRRPRVWPAVVIVGAFWALLAYEVALWDEVISTKFTTTALACMLTTLLFVVWWLGFSRVSWSERLLVFAAAIAGGAVAVAVSAQTLGALGAIFFGIPLLLTLWTLWMLVSRHLSGTVRQWGLVATIVLAWGFISLLRADGINGAQMADFHWRWTATAEQLYVASLPTADEAAGALPGDEPLALAVGDWGAFRGPNGLGQQEHAAIATNWSDAPPKLAWRRPIGPSWASFVVVGPRLFTAEQREEDEVTVCLDAATGQEIWKHVDRARFWDGQAGAGPRATPTFHDGRLYSYGATGILNCLDAATGKLVWTRNVVDDTKAPLPMWGFSSSPLVVDSLVIVFAGGPDDKGLVAYEADTGEPAWSAASGPISYSSAQLVTIDGQKQALLLSDTGVVAVDPASGKTLWDYEANASGIWRVVQPRAWGDAQVLVGSEDIGLALLEVAREGDGWQATEKWATNQMRPAFNDYVVVDGCAYGFDKGLFCCLDLATGKRKWKGGRYGYGQVLLLSPQKLLVVLTEQGEVVLLSANPEKLEELGRFEALSGKTWNHPVVAHNRLYVRNDREMAAYELAPAAVETP